MRWKSEPDRYGAVAAALHWASAALLLFLLGSGFRAGDMADADARSALLRLHVAAGVLVALLTIARILWWSAFDRRPAPPAGAGLVAARAARWVHAAFYVLIVAMGVSGVGMVVLSGAGPALLQGAPLPDFSPLPPRGLHARAALAILALTAVHVAAALYHRWVLGHDVLARMWPRRARPGG